MWAPYRLGGAAEWNRTLAIVAAWVEPHLRAAIARVAPQWRPALESGLDRALRIQAGLLCLVLSSLSCFLRKARISPDLSRIWFHSSR